MIKLAIVSPCYNEEEVLEESTTRLTALFDDLVAKKKISADSFVLFVNVAVKIVHGALLNNCTGRIHI